MEVHGTQRQNTQLLNIQIALLDFARLSQLASSADRQLAAPTATLLLERVMTLCQAQRGAIMLANTADVSPANKTPSFGGRVLASKGLRVEEIDALSGMATSAEKQHALDDYRWYRADLPLTGIQTKQPLVAIVLLGQPHITHSSQETITGEVQSIMLLVEDAFKAVISSMVLAERVDELENMTNQEMVAELEQLKSELLNTMSHELRSPLTSIKGYTATLLHYGKRLRHEEQHEFLEAIRDASDILSVIVDRLLEMAQFEAGSIQLHTSPVDMVHLAQEAIDVAQQSRHYRLVTATHPDFFTFPLLTLDEQGVPADTLPPVQGDQRRLRELLDNILENALKFSPNGGAITVTLRPVTSPPPEHVRSQHGEMPGRPMLGITIHDHGEGIASEHLVRIFDRFQRVDTRLTREVNGLGLGLALCKCIVTLHHGYVWAESRPGEGSAFHIWLPLAQTADMQPIES